MPPNFFFFDMRTDRHRHWTAAGLNAAVQANVLPGDPTTPHQPTFFLLHTTDIARYVTECEGTLAFEERLRSFWGPATAVVYFSGRSDPWLTFAEVAERPPLFVPIENYRRPTTNWSHIHQERLGEEKSQALDAFSRRLCRLLSAWRVSAGAEPPNWKLLLDDWAEGCFDHASALLLDPTRVCDIWQSALQREVLDEDKLRAGVEQLTAAHTHAGRLRLSKLLAKTHNVQGLEPALLRRLKAASEHLDGTLSDQRGAEAEQFAAHRSRIHHDYFLNILIDSLGDGWDTSTRLGDSDMILKALDGDERSCCDLRDVLNAWKDKGSLALAELVALAERMDPPALSPTDSQRLREADSTITGCLEGTPGRSPKEHATAFWEACECLESFLRPGFDRLGGGD